MCGRYALTYDSGELVQAMARQLGQPVREVASNGDGNGSDYDDEEDSVSYHKSFNVAPTNRVPVYLNAPQRESGAGREDSRVLMLMRWGFVPHWAKDLDSFKGYATINARLENLLSSRLWGQSCKGKRCFVPISGYYEWTKAGSGMEMVRDKGKRRGNAKVSKGKASGNNENASGKTPYYLTRNRDYAEKAEGNEVMYLAGLYDYNEANDLYSFTIVTGHAPKELEWLHVRMPCVVEPGSETWDQWLDPDKTEWTQKELDALLKPSYDEKLYTCYEVSKDVGKVTNKESYLIEPVTRERQVKQESGKETEEETKETEEETKETKHTKEKAGQLTKPKKEDKSDDSEETGSSTAQRVVKQEDKPSDDSSKKPSKRKSNVVEMLQKRPKRSRK